MKVSLSEDTARKILALTDDQTPDQDIRQFRDRIQKGLDATTGAGFLSAGDLGTLTFLVNAEIREPKHTEPGGPFVQALAVVLPKLRNLLDRRVAEGGGAES